MFTMFTTKADMIDHLNSLYSSQTLHNKKTETRKQDSLGQYWGSWSLAFMCFFSSGVCQIMQTSI